MRFLALFALPVAFTDAYHVSSRTGGTVVVGLQTRSTRPSTELRMGIPLLGRFRKKKEVQQPKTIAIGAELPDVDIELLEDVTGDDGPTINTIPITVKEALGDSKSILLGMPGAFTPTCSELHLPGYIEKADKLSKLGVETIAVVTTNDNHVNKAWGKTFGLLGNDSGKKGPVQLLCDGDGEFVRRLGLAEDQGFGLGVRSTRFAIVSDGGKVTHLLTEGMDECEATSAENLVNILTPTPVPGQEVSGEGSGGVIIAAGGLLALAALAFQLTSGDLSAPLTAPPPSSSTDASTTVVNKSGKASKLSKSKGYSFLKDVGK